MSALLSQLPHLLAAFLPRIRQEAERLVDDDSVRGLDIVDDEALAEVRLDDVKVNTRWALEEGQWRGDTDTEDDTLHQLSLCTA
jgi:hypothetical protein